MSQSIQVNGQTISYPETGDTNWGDNATNFAIQTSSAFGKLGLDSGTSVDIPQTLDVTGNTTLDANLSVGGVIYADDNTTANTPVISFTGDTNTGIGRSAADTLDFITNGNSRFRIESTGQIKAVYESQVGTDYNTRLDNGYLCRAWAKIKQYTQSISSSGNISSLVDGGNGVTTFNFTNSMPDTEYSVFLCSDGNSTENWSYVSDSYSTGSIKCLIGYTPIGTTTFALTDRNIVTIGIFR